MKDFFESAKIELIRFDSADVIATSTGSTGGADDPISGGGTNLDSL